ncbi:hypothetical protein HYV86_05580 [Candidatus Woesearchaeota archaeon]|nr:hypothetical protein [Candidatus Woesearchaeota archaeon]
MEKSNHTTIIIAVVALVAIVAVVMFGFNKTEFSSVSEEGEEGAVAGEAILARGNLLPAGQNLVFIGFNTISDHYGNVDFQTTKTASQICRDMGYRGCFAGQMEKIMHYYESADGSCRRPQFQPADSVLVPCNEAGRAIDDRLCQTWDAPSVEPELGDNNYHQILTEVICKN